MKSRWAALPSALIAACAAAMLAGLATGCAQAPAAAAAPTDAVPPDCTQLEDERRRVESARREAQARQDGAWKAVVPFVVAGRWASGKADVAEADQRLAALQAERMRLACVSGEP